MRLNQLDGLLAFWKVAEHRGFSAAAAALEVSPSALSQAIRTLETRLGVRLLNRNSRAVSLTDAGLLLLERSRPMLELADVTRAELQDRARVPSGRLRISAPHGLDLTELPALINIFLGHYPEVSISLVLTNRMVDLAEEGIDIALRFGPSADENLIVRKLVSMELSVCAAPMYWREHGVPAHPSELARHIALTSTQLNPLPKWRFEADGQPIEVAVRGRLDATESGPLIQAALLGGGVVYLPYVVLKPYVESGRLVPVLSDFGRRDMWLSAVYLQRRHNTAVHRALLDYLADRLKPMGSRGEPPRR